jgi:hypothetical protein
VLEKREPHLFTSVCRFIVRENSVAVPAMLYHDRRFPDVYTDLGVDIETLIHLNTIGLLFFAYPFLANTVRHYDAPAVDLEYFGEVRTFLVPKKDPNDPRTGEYAFNFGVVDLTKVGRELAGIAGAEPVEGFFDFLEAEWAKAGVSRKL